MGTSRKAWIQKAGWFGVLLFLAGCTVIEPKSQLSLNAQAEALSRFSMGMLARESGQRETALAYFKEALQIDPHAELIYPAAAELAIQLNQQEYATELAQLFLERFPDKLAPRILLGQVYTLTGRKEEAEALFQNTISDFPNDPESYLILARFFISDKNYEDAIRVLESANRLNEKNADVLHLLGSLRIEGARDINYKSDFYTSMVNGIELLEESLQLAPDKADRWIQLGYALLAVQENERARNAFEKAHELSPSDLITCQQLLNIYIHSDDYRQALEFCEGLSSATGTDPQLWIQYLIENSEPQHQEMLCEYLEKVIANSTDPSVYLYVQASILYLELKKNDEAAHLLKRALKDFPDDIRLRSAAAYLAVQQKNFEEAFDLFDLIQTDTPDIEWFTNPFFCINYIVSAQKTGHLNEASDFLSKAYINNPSILNHYVQELLSGSLPESTSSSIDILRRFYAENPKTTETLYYMTLLQMEQKKYKEALENARQFLTQASEQERTKKMIDGLFYYQYALLHERTGKLDEAERIFRKAIKISDPATAASAQNYIAYMWAERGKKLDMGLDLIQKALETDPANGAYLDTLGWVYYMQERYDQALEALLKASEGIQDDPVIWEHLGDTYLKLGNLPDAVKYWKKALKLSPGSLQLIKRLEENPITSKDPDTSEDVL